MIESVFTGKRNGPLIARAAELWIKPDALVMDVTFGKGNWYTDYIPAFFITHDIELDKVDFRNLPEQDSSIDVVMFDPPYVSKGGRKTSGIKDFDDAYGLEKAPKSPIEVQLLINAGITEIHRVLKPKGLMFVKVCDYVSSGSRFWGHFQTQLAAANVGFKQIDEFVHYSGTAMQPKKNLDGSIRRQVHSRRSHSFLMIFEKLRTVKSRQDGAHGR